MAGDSSVSRARRTYNQWVANETLEDFALRFTAFRARKWSSLRVANTAIGSISFLALEAIGGAMTLSYGFNNAVAAILIVGAVLFITGLPISYHSARAGVDIDLLTRGAGFGYLGSTVTSLIYAGFTFIFFALEAAILSQALEYCLGIPLEIGYLLNALLVIPLVTHGFARIGAFQKWTQPLWILLQILPFAALVWVGVDLAPWVEHMGLLQTEGAGLDLVMVAAATGIAFALIAQIGEQVDFLRFLPKPETRRQRISWWLALISAGPGWAVIGTLKMLAGSFLTVLILNAGVPAEAAIEPTKMYLIAYERFLPPEAALVLTIGFVILAQLKINVTNAYAGSIAWSNFFARITHSHPGRVVWLVFNVAIALMLMEFGVFGALENTLAIYSHVALAWIGAITADLMINLPLGLRPKQIEFRRAYLFDINPVGVGAAVLAALVSLTVSLGVFGNDVAAFSSWIAFGTAMLAAPAIALATRGHYYLARQPETASASGERVCIICEHKFDLQDMVDCPFHRGSVCSLCCTLESSCEDACKPAARMQNQIAALAISLLPEPATKMVLSRYGGFGLTFSAMALIVGVLLLIVYQNFQVVAPDAADAVGRALALSFVILVILVGVTAWLYTLSEESRVLANRERESQTQRLLEEIEAHRRTDAELQAAKEAAEAANRAKSRYLVGITHELRTPLNAILGYAQLLENDQTIPEHRRPSVRTIRHSSEHLADLIEGLLDISKIEAGRIEVYRVEVNLLELLDQISAIFAIEAQAKGLEFVADIAPNVPAFVFADERRVRQILINLLSNAVRYTAKGSVRLSVSFQNDIAHIIVSDTGRGIPRSEWHRIFTPFERIIDPNDTVPGTGLGLTITKLLIEMLGGELTLTSEPGKGSTFRVRLFLNRSQRTAPSEQERPRRGYVGRLRHILIVDDNLQHRQLLADALGPLGFLLSMAESGEVALSIARANPPDLALIDVAMPGMSGVEVVAQLRQECSSKVPLVLVSAHAGDQLHRLNGTNASHDGFIAKPVNIPVLLDRVGTLLGLTWSYDPPDTCVEAPLYAPQAVLDTMEQALSIGHLRGLQQALAGMDRDDEKTRQFSRRAAALIEAVDLEGLTTLLKDSRHAG